MNEIVWTVLLFFVSSVGKEKHNFKEITYFMCSENTNGYNFAKKKNPCSFKNSFHLKREIKLLASNVNRYHYGRSTSPSLLLYTCVYFWSMKITKPETLPTTWGP